MTLQRGVRLAAAVVGLSCAAAIYYWSRRQPPPPPPPARVQLADPKATSEARGGRFTRLKGGKPAYTLEYGHQAEYPDGHSRYETVTLVTTRGDRRFEIHADAAEEGNRSAAKDTPGVVSLTGHVTIDTSDGVHAECDSATYEDASSMVRIPGAFKFTRGRLGGDSVGAMYDRGRDLLTLQANAHVTMAPDPGGHGAIDATAQSIDFERPSKRMTLRADARLVRDDQTLSSDTAFIRLTPDEQGVERLDMRGHASVVPREGSTSGAPDMRARDITLLFYRDGRTVQRSTLDGNAALVLINETGRRTITAGHVETTVAPDGRTLTRLSAKDSVVVTLPKTQDTPARRIQSSTLAAQGTEGVGLTSALFDGGVRFTETQPASADHPAVERTGTSRSLNLVLAGQIDAIDEAEFRQDAVFVDSDVSASGDRAQYFAKQGRLRLSPASTGSTRLPTLTRRGSDGGTFRIDGRALTVAIDSRDVDALGDVVTTTVSAPRGGSGPRGSALFENGKPISGSAPEVHYSGADHKARYVGTALALAVVWQDQNSVKARTIEVEEQSGNLSAEGDVKSVFLMDKTPGSAKDEPSRESGEAPRMVYVDAAHRATYTGDASHPAIVRGTEGTVEGKTVDLFMAKEQRSLDRLVADGIVFATLASGREANGDHLVYEAATGNYTLTGGPARVKASHAQGQGTGQTGAANCSLTSGRTLTFASGGGSSGSGDGAPVATTMVDCAQSLRSIKDAEVHLTRRGSLARLMARWRLVPRRVK